MHDKDAPLIRIIEIAAHGKKLSLIEAARKAKMAEKAVFALVDEEPEFDPDGIHRLGHVLGLASDDFWHMVAAAAARQPRDIAHMSGPYRFWRYALSKGLKVADLARSMVVMAFAMRYQATGSLLASPVMQELGITKDDPSLVVEATRSLPHPQLAAWVDRFLQQIKAGAVTPNLLRHLKAGVTPRLLDPELPYVLAKATKENVDGIISLLSEAQDPHGGGRSLPSLLASWCYKNRRPLNVLAVKLDMNREHLLRALQGLDIAEKHVPRLQQALELTNAEWVRATSRTTGRRVMPSIEFERFRRRTKSLQDLVIEASRSAGKTPIKWADGIGLSRWWVQHLFTEARVPSTREVRLRLCSALNIDRASFDASCRLMAMHPRRIRQEFLDIKPRCAAQESLISYLETTNSHMVQVITATRVTKSVLTRLIHHGIPPKMEADRSALAKFLGMAPGQFEEALIPDEVASESVDDPQEQRILALVRQMPSETKAALLEHARHLLATGCAGTSRN
jgi:hypothetical protein